LETAYFYNTKLGSILITEDELGITGLSLIPNQEAVTGDEQFLLKYNIAQTEQIKETAKQLNEYLEGERKNFEISINPKGTEFQRKVWMALRAIPYGETRSYKQIAYAVGNEKAARAVGMANHNNPILCIIPCHRVIGANGNLVGFGAGLPIKEQLLNLERTTNE
jgi:methylated-DNA-[protein]-cysteine S-methyltransferase